MPTNDERREVAKRIREMYYYGGIKRSAVFYEALNDVIMGQDGFGSFQDIAARLADLIDPVEHERTVADNLALIDRNRELECELVRVKRKLERTRSASCIDHERAVLADKLEDENLELKKRLGCFDGVTPPVSWYASMRDRCERLERELVEAYRRQND